MKHLKVLEDANLVAAIATQIYHVFIKATPEAIWEAMLTVTHDRLEGAPARPRVSAARGG
ncbi:hypothetical protein [Occultella aeris]|nr:hypothetical protein [Occultella aeris]